MAPKRKFADGEKVLCFHGPLMYEAKCLKSMAAEDKTFKYFIHYAGWNKNWDEWVPETRVLKYNEANIAKQKELQKNHSGQSSKGKKSKNRKVDSSNLELSPNAPVNEASQAGKNKLLVTTPANGSDSSSDSTKKKRGGLDDFVETEELLYAKKDELQVKLPDELKPWLLDDWDIITRQRKLPNLPARITVDEIMNNYFGHKKAMIDNDSYRESVALEISNGIKDYFNVMLGTQLLYKFERPQYAQMLLEHPDIPVSKIYGAIHLLRLFVKLGTMLAFTSLDEKSAELLISNIQDFLNYMIQNSSSLLSLQDYTSALPEYLRKALI